MLIAYADRVALHSAASGGLFGQELREWTASGYGFRGDLAVASGVGEAYATTTDGKVAVRVEGRYDCLWTRACGLFNSVDTYGDRAERLPNRLAEELRSGSYKPQAIKRVEIPKPGTKETRPLGIPTVRDRVVQTGS